MPRPANWRGAFCHRMPSSSSYFQSVWPLAGSIANAARRVLATVKSRPFA